MSAVAYKEAFKFDQAEDVAEQTRTAKEWAEKVFAENPSSIFDEFSAAEWASRDARDEFVVLGGKGTLDDEDLEDLECA
ncbi:hypothetical protein [Thalassospira povalilytica]|uniref:hypothetical protein n=1 Tax=Thalassospira povalilytica TaxID=732237 RepID=UPI001D192335|nr:hypothetical protein [Thalassospira povalilytica]MCC4238734.1 hypothetical protein [Thalassospira povalilytica]